MNGQELATAVQYKLPIIAVVLDNSTFGTIRMHQEREYPGRVSGTDLVNPDFAAMARAFGGFGAHGGKDRGFCAGFHRRGKKRPAVGHPCEVRCRGHHAHDDPVGSSEKGSRRLARPAGLRAPARHPSAPPPAATRPNPACAGVEPYSLGVVRHVMGVEDHPAILVPHPRDGGLDRILVPAAHFQRNGVELGQVHAARIETRMHAANGSEASRHHFLGAQAGLAIGIGIADQRLAFQEGLQEFKIALGIGFKVAGCDRLGVG